MKYSIALALVCSASLAACTLPEVTTSSRTFLGPQESGALLGHAPIDAAREVTRLFEVRGFAMADQRAAGPGGALLLRYTKSQRALAADKADDAMLFARDVGSVFYVWIAPSPTGAQVTLIGKPTLNGAEPCSTDMPPGLACTPITANAEFIAAYMSGRNEADVVHGILAQLALEGYVAGTLPPTPAEAAEQRADATCADRRHRIFSEAQAASSPDVRAKLLESAPVCDGSDR